MVARKEHSLQEHEVYHQLCIRIVQFKGIPERPSEDIAEQPHVQHHAEEGEIVGDPSVHGMPLRITVPSKLFDPGLVCSFRNGWNIIF